MRALHYSVVMKRELSKKAMLLIFKAVFVPILTYGHESWVMTERMRSQVQASEMRFLHRIEGVTLFTGLPQKLQNQIPGLSRTFLGHFPGLFQDCLRFFFQDLKFNFDYYSHAPTLLYL